METYAKMKELGLVGGQGERAHWRRPLDPPMVRIEGVNFTFLYLLKFMYYELLYQFVATIKLLLETIKVKVLILSNEINIKSGKSLFFCRTGKNICEIEHTWSGENTWTI